VLTCEGADVSANGVRVQSAQGLPSGTRCTVEIRLTDSCVIQAPSVVVRSTDGGFAASFLELDIESFMLLKQYILHNASAEDHVKVEREFRDHLGILTRR